MYIYYFEGGTVYNVEERLTLVQVEDIERLFGNLLKIEKQN